MAPKEIKDRLVQRYPGCAVEVVDLTGTQDHYQVRVVSPVFAGLNRIQQHKHVMDAFSAELKSGEVHALTIRTELPAAPRFGDAQTDNEFKE